MNIPSNLYKTSNSIGSALDTNGHIIYNPYQVQLPDTFLSKTLIFALFNKPYKKKTDSYVVHLCNEENTLHMYKIIKRLKKAYLKNKLWTWGIKEPISIIPLGRGQFGAVFSFILKDKSQIISDIKEQLLLKLTGQSKIISNRGGLLPVLNTKIKNEIIINTLIYNNKYKDLNGFNYVVRCLGGVLVQCYNNKCKVYTYFDNQHKDEQKWLNNFKRLTNSYLDKNSNIQLDILIIFSNKFGDGTTLSSIIIYYLYNIDFILLIATFMLEFMLIIHNIKDFGLSGLSHNDLHLDNIIVDHELLDRLLNNKLLITKYPFRVIDFGLSKSRIKKDRDISSIIKLFKNFPIFVNFMKKYDITNQPIEIILSKFIDYITLTNI